MIYPYSMLESVVPEAALNQFRNTEYFLTSSNHTASFENLATVLTETVSAAGNFSTTPQTPRQTGML